jgi:plasmid replication initiation protein
MKQENKYLEIRNNTVIKANELIQKSRFSLSTQQQKVVLYLISQISPYDEDFKLYDFSIVEFCKVCGIDYESGKNYADLKNAIKEIADKSLWIKLGNGKETLVRWIEKPYIDEKSGRIQIKLDKDMKPYLLQLKQNFTQYELLWTLKFKSKYAIRLYELVKSIHFHELETYSKIYDLSELQILLGAETHKTYQHFKDRVLLPAIAEINNHSDKNVEFEPIKRSKAVSQIRLTVSTKEPMERVKLHSDIEHEFGMDQETIWDMINKSKTEDSEGGLS